MSDPGCFLSRCSCGGNKPTTGNLCFSPSLSAASSFSVATTRNRNVSLGPGLTLGGSVAPSENLYFPAGPCCALC